MNLDISEGVIFHQDNIINRVDDNFCELIGVESSKNIINTSISNYIIKDDIDSVEANFEQVKENDKTLGIQTQLQYDNKKLNVISVSYLMDSKQEIKTTFININESESNWFQSIRDDAMHQAPVGITIADITIKDEPLIYINDNFIEMTGYKRQDIIGQNCRFLQGEKTNKEPVSKMRNAIKNNEATTVELLNYRKDGSTFWNRVTISPVYNKENELKYYVGFQEDITASKRNEKQKSVFERYIEVSNQPMCLTDSNWDIEYTNPAFEKLTEYSKKELRGNNISIFEPNDSDYNIYDDLNENNIWTEELINKKKNGELYHIKQTVTPIKNENNIITNYIIIQEDLTQSKLNEQVLGVLNRVLRHNLRSSINVIEGYADMLTVDSDSDQQKIAIQKIQNRTKSMNEISNKMTNVRNLIRDYEKPQPLKVEHLRDTVLPYQDMSDVELSLDIKYDGNQKIKYGNIFQIAFDEAINYSIIDNEKDISQVDITITRGSKDTLSIEIKDNKSRISDLEWSVIKSGNETPLEHTSGIGLWIIYWAVTAMGGSIELTDNELSGNTFKINIPLI